MDVFGNGTGLEVFLAVLFRARAQATGYSPPGMSPGLRPPPWFRCGSTRCPVHSGRGSGAGRSTTAL